MFVSKVEKTTFPPDLEEAKSTEAGDICRNQILIFFSAPLLATRDRPIENLPVWQGVDEIIKGLRKVTKPIAIDVATQNKNHFDPK